VKIERNGKTYILDTSQCVLTSGGWVTAWIPEYAEAPASWRTRPNNQNSLGWSWNRYGNKGKKIVEATKQERQALGAWMWGMRKMARAAAEAAKKRKVKTAAEEYHDFYFSSKQGV